jgi:magnesium transporter
MLRDPFYLEPGMTLTEAMNAVLTRHFPVYPVCDGGGKLLGLLRGQMLLKRKRSSLRR